MGSTGAARTRAETSAPPSDLALLSHDLRQYLAACRMLTVHPGDDVLEESVRRRFEALDDLLQQMSSLLQAAELTAEDSTSTDLRALVDDCARIVRLTRHTSIVIEPRDDVSAPGSPALLRRALTNILDNAARASGPSGAVRVAISGTEDAAVVEIADDGEGWGKIPRVHGNGLASARLALRRCRGRLEIEPSPGHGTTVRIVLPTQRTGKEAS